MTEESENTRKLSRRQFVKTAAAGAVAVGTLAGCGAAATAVPCPTCPPAPTAVTCPPVPTAVTCPEPPPCPTAEPCPPCETVKLPWLPEKWDQEADVVIIGAGGAGIVAAIEAANGGASVLFLEKADVVGGTTSLSGAIIQAAGTEAQKAWGVVGDNPERHYEYWITASEGQADPALVKVLADNAPKNIEWLIEQGLEYHSLTGVAPIPYIDPSLMVDRIHTPGPVGAMAAVGNGKPNHVEPLWKVAQEKGAQILYETPATGLLRDPEKGVIGVIADSDGETIYVKANKAVILATSSFDHNEEMARAFSLQQLWAIQTGLVATAPTDTGDGIKMAMEIGADLAGMGGTIGFPMPGVGGAAAPGIWVNQFGQRFVNEVGHYAFRSRAVFNQVQHLAWAVFDDKVKQAGGAALGWSDDLSKEIESGVVIAGDTLAALAEAAGINASGLEMTVAKWNEDVAAGKDTLYDKAEGLQALDTGPYYASKVFEWNLGSHGGVKINTEAQVIDVQGEVIPHLYAGGMVAGGIVGPYYPGSGTAVAITVCYGRIAGQNAAAEKAWA